jgi:DNA-binding IclR family transcriptional regulator
MINPGVGKKYSARIALDKNERQLQVPENGRGEPSEAKSIYRASLILDCISHDVNSLSEIADASKLTRSTTHRLLKALAKSHLVIHDPVSRLYFLGPSITQFIANPKLTHEYLVNASLKEMNYLAEVTEETIVLGVLIGLNHVSLHAIESAHALKIAQAGSRVGPLHTGAASRALLAQLNATNLNSILDKIQFESWTEYTVTNKEDLLNRVRLVKKQGYAISYNEKIAGSIGIAAPVKDYIIPAALSIVGPESRMKPRTAQFAEKLISATNRISRNLSETLNV